MNFLIKINLKFEISDVKYLVKFWGQTSRPAKEAPNISGANFGKKSETSFQTSRLFSETSFSRRAVLTMSDQSLCGRVSNQDPIDGYHIPSSLYGPSNHSTAWQMRTQDALTAP